MGAGAAVRPVWRAFILAFREANSPGEPLENVVEALRLKFSDLVLPDLE
jgi:hypothetical protein